jgi:hypothetical protein
MFAVTSSWDCRWSWYSHPFSYRLVSVVGNYTLLLWETNLYQHCVPYEFDITLVHFCTCHLYSFLWALTPHRYSWHSEMCHFMSIYSFVSSLALIMPYYCSQEFGDGRLAEHECWGCTAMKRKHGFEWYISISETQSIWRELFCFNLWILKEPIFSQREIVWLSKCKIPK